MAPNSRYFGLMEVYRAVEPFECWVNSPGSVYAVWDLGLMAEACVLQGVVKHLDVEFYQ